MEKADFRSLGFAAISWIEHYLVHGPGDVQGEPVELDDEFAAFLLKAYRVDARGHRRVRRAFLSRSKGRSKSGFAAMIECFEALGPARFDHWAERDEVSDWGYEYEVGEPVGEPLLYVEILNVATEESQAGNTYDAVYYMLNPDTCSPELLEDYGKLDVGLSRINLPGKRGFIEPVTASNESKDGGKSTFIVADETHLWIPPMMGKFKLGKMHQTMVRNLLKRKVASGWMLETSTMYADGEGSVAEGTHAYAKALAGRNDGKLLFDHRQASASWNLESRRERVQALREAYGPAAAWMDLEAIADYWDDPQATHAEFKRYWLNQPVPLEEPTPSPLPGWDACAIHDEPPPPLVIGLAVSLDGVWGSIAAGSQWPDGRVHVGAVERRRGTDWLVGEAKRIQTDKKCTVVMDEKCPDASLLKDLREAGVNVRTAKLEEYIEACSEIVKRVESKSVTHSHTTELDDAIRGAAWRMVNDRKVWGRKQSNCDISMLEAATFSVWVARSSYDPLQSVF
jgi:hypothetical protein